MKKILLLGALIIISNLLHSQTMPIDNTTGLVTYSGVIIADSTTKDELYNRAKEWIVLTYNSAKDVIQLDDKTNGKLICKGTFKVSHVMGDVWYIDHTLKLEFKENKWKYTITQILYSSYDCVGCQTPKPIENCKITNTEKFKEKIDTQIKSIISSLKPAMQTQSNGTTNDNW